MKNKLIFVYNADGGIFNMATDYVHKIASPKTYPCSLCKISYGNLGMKREWKQFIEALPYEVEFPHRDELPNNYPTIVGTPLPAVFILKNEMPELLISAEKMNGAESIEGLKLLVTEALS